MTRICRQRGQSRKDPSSLDVANVVRLVATTIRPAATNEPSRVSAFFFKATTPTRAGAQNWVHQTRLDSPVRKPPKAYSVVQMRHQYNQ